jgi:hypothetical protein
MRMLVATKVDGIRSRHSVPSYNVTLGDASSRAFWQTIQIGGYQGI